MEPNGRDGRRGRPDGGLFAAAASPDPGRRTPDDLIFEFTPECPLGLKELALLLTARLQSGPHERVWVRHIPYQTWNVLRALGMDHFFQVYPSPGEAPN